MARLSKEELYKENIKDIKEANKPDMAEELERERLRYERNEGIYATYGGDKVEGIGKGTGRSALTEEDEKNDWLFRQWNALSDEKRERLGGKFSDVPPAWKNEMLKGWRGTEAVGGSKEAIEEAKKKDIAEEKARSEYDSMGLPSKKEIAKPTPKAVKKVEPKPTAKTITPKEEPKEEPTEETSPSVDEKEIEKSNEETSSISENKKEAEKILDGKIQLSEYLNSGYPTTAGLIFSPKSGLKWYERIGMGLKVIGQITGNALLANGMSLLGDNSYFAKIGEGLDVDSMTTDNQREFAKKLNDSSIETAKQVVQNRDLINKLYVQQGIDNISKEKLDFLAYFTTTVASMPQDEAVAELERNGFTAEEAQTAYQNAIIASKTTGSAQNLAKGAVDVEGSKLDLFNKKFKNAEEINAVIRELRKQEQALQEKLVDISSMEFDKMIKFATDNRELMQGIASMASNASSSTATGETSNSNWSTSVSAGVKLPVLDIGASGSGGHSWGSTLNMTNAQGLSNTMDFLAKAGIDTGKAQAKEWWKEHGEKLQKGMYAGIESAIKDIKTQIAEYEALKGKKKGESAPSDENLKDIQPMNDYQEEFNAIWKWLTDLDSFEYGERNIERIKAMLN